MTRNLSLIPTIEAEPETELEAVPPAHVVAAGTPTPIVVLAERRREPPRRENRGRASPRSRSARRWREIGNAALIATGIAVLFLAVAWPLYLWIGR